MFTLIYKFASLFILNKDQTSAQSIQQDDGKVEIIRPVSQNEMEKIKQAWNILEKFIKDTDKKENKRIYFHVHLNGKDTDAISVDLLQELKNICQNVLNYKKKGEIDQYKIIAIGFMTLQSGCEKQDWHQDYEGETGMVFLNLTEETENNATKFLDKYNGYDISYQILSKENYFTYIPIGQWHKGIVNDENFRRTVFNFVFLKKQSNFYFTQEKVFKLDDKVVITVDADEYVTVLDK